MKHIVLCLLILVTTGCAAMQAGMMGRRGGSFVQSDPGWTAIEMRSGSYDKAWETVFSLLVADFDIDYASKDYGYVRTHWSHSRSGVYQTAYRVRVTIKFAADRKSLRIKTEAHQQYAGGWIVGVDSELAATLKTDIMGTIGRAVR